jgi:uncharacterized RDD family membrane protein YckC
MASSYNGDAAFMDWYYAESGRQVGPIKEEALEELARSGVVKPETLVWQQGMSNWQAYRAVRPMGASPAAYALPVAAGAPEPASRFCSECGLRFPHSELVPFGSSLVCAGCKETFTHKLREGVAPTGAVRYGGFWIRFVAILIDGAILFTVSMLLNVIGALFFVKGAGARAPAAMVAYSGALLAYQGIMFLVNVTLGLSYTVFFLTRYGATPGKMVLRLKVITTRGGPISAPLAVGRFFANYVSALTLGIGYIMAGIDEQKRALHDRVCDTRVIYA